MSAIELSQQDISEAIERIAQTRDGAVLYRHLQKVLCSVVVSEKVGALPINEGRRTFASELMALMAAGIRTHDRTDSILTFALAGARPRADAGRGAGRRITPDTPIPGWERPEPA